MVKRCFTADIFWLGEDAGGRHAPPPEGTRYCPIIETQGDVSWSIDFTCPDFSASSSICFSFLSDKAPYNLIVVGEEYGLFEGSKKVAVVTIRSNGFV